MVLFLEVSTWLLWCGVMFYSYVWGCSSTGIATFVCSLSLYISLVVVLVVYFIRFCFGLLVDFPTFKLEFPCTLEAIAFVHVAKRHKHL